MSGDSRSLAKYNVWCVTENIYVETPGYHEEVPIGCPNNNGHTIDANQTTELDRIDENHTIVVDDDEGVGGYYRSQGINFDVDPGVDVVTIHDLSFPYSVRAFSAHINASSDNVGDEISYCSGYDTDTSNYVPGSNNITLDASSGSTVIEVNSNFFLFVKLGFIIKIKEGVIEEELGECINIDTVNNTITVATATTGSFTVAGGAKILFSISRFANIEIANAGMITLGSAKLGGSLAPPNLPQRITYINRDGVAKRIRLIAEITH